MSDFIFLYIETLEVGGNNKVKTKYSLDTNVLSDNAINITWNDVKPGNFDLILLKNSINYLTEDEVLKLIGSLKKKDGFILANTFLSPPKLKISECEISYFDGNFISHLLYDGRDKITKHCFYGYSEDFWNELGFSVTKYNINSGLLKYQNDGIIVEPGNGMV